MYCQIQLTYFCFVLLGYKSNCKFHIFSLYLCEDFRYSFVHYFRHEQAPAQNYQCSKCQLSKIFYSNLIMLCIRINDVKSFECICDCTLLVCIHLLIFHFERQILKDQPVTAVGLNPARDFGFFHVRKLSSWLTEHRWCYSGA